MLVGIDPDYRETVVVNGASFTIRRIPFGLWQRLRSEALEAFAGARRRAIAALAARGEGEDEKRLVMEANRDPVYRQELARIEAEVVRWGVAGHDGFVKADGTTPVPFETEPATTEGEVVQVVGRETMRWYRGNAVIVAALHNQLWRINELGPSEKKA